MSKVLLGDVVDSRPTRLAQVAQVAQVGRHGRHPQEKEILAVASRRSVRVLVVYAVGSGSALISWGLQSEQWIGNSPQVGLA